MLNNISDKILRNKLKYHDTIIVGENSIGKSDLLRMLLERGEGRKIYFLDSVNRRFSIGKINFEKKEFVYKTAITRTRLDEKFFNLKDSFNVYETMGRRPGLNQAHFRESIQNMKRKL